MPVQDSWLSPSCTSSLLDDLSVFSPRLREARQPRSHLRRHRADLVCGLLRVPAGRCLLRVAKDRPSTVLGAEKSASRVDVATIASEPGCHPSRAPSSWFCATWTVYSFSTLPGYCAGLPVMGFVMFRRRDSDSPSRVPTLRSVAPREQRTPSGLLRSMPGPRHPSQSPGLVHREPCPLVLGRLHDRNLEAFLHSRSRDVRCRCRPRPPLASMGLPAC